MATINLTIIGLSRLGASFGLALKRYMKSPSAQHQFVITGNDESPDAMHVARKLEAIDHEVRSPGSAVAKADLVILAARNSLYDDLYEIIGPELKPGAVLLDLSPLKSASIERAKRHLPRDENKAFTAYMVGATPILNPALLHDAATDTESARADLFDKGTMILSPAVNCRGEAIQLASDLSTLLGMSVHFTDPDEHDGMVAAMEALPLLVNLGLFRSLSQARSWDDLRRLGNPSFALATIGLDQYTAEDAAAAINGNRERTVQALESLISTLDEIRDALLADDELLLAEAFADSIERRNQWMQARHKNEWGAQDTLKPPTTPGMLGSLGGLLGMRALRGGDKNDDKANKK